MKQDTGKGLVEAFCQYFIESGRIQGADESISRLLAIVYLEPGEIAMDELMQRTGYSLASVSNKIRLLEGLGVLRRIRHPGSRKIFLYMEKDLFSEMKKQMVEKQLAAIALAHERIPQIIKRYGSSQNSAQDRKRLKIVTDYYRQMQKAERLMKKLAAFLKEED